MRQTCSYRGESGPRDSILCVSVSVADGARPKSGAANRIPPLPQKEDRELVLGTLPLPREGEARPGKAPRARSLPDVVHRESGGGGLCAR
jgi:hypothetical protein